MRLKPRRLGRGQRDRRYPAGARGLPGTPGPTPLKRQHELGEDRLRAPDSAGRKHPPHNRTREAPHNDDVLAQKSKRAPFRRPGTCEHKTVSCPPGVRVLLHVFFPEAEERMRAEGGVWWAGLDPCPGATPTFPFQILLNHTGSSTHRFIKCSCLEPCLPKGPQEETSVS